ncbi:hypothetical protein QE152_g27210 [Popillia japonica]|uniref:Uncharacterized protein n=1 Tax=Popillia japonica TaxID=7064 RepID=A0AAW1JVE6_POPJA
MDACEQCPFLLCMMPQALLALCMTECQRIYREIQTDFRRASHRGEQRTSRLLSRKGLLKSVSDKPPDDYPLFQSDPMGHHAEWTIWKTFNQIKTKVALVKLN